MKKILHIHYSGIVRNKILINYLIKKNIGIKITSLNHVYLSQHNIKNRYIYNRLWTIIKTSKNHFIDIGEMWYYVIKNINFIKDYNSLIIKEMHLQSVDYIEFRIRLGTHFNPNNYKRISIKDELTHFDNIQYMYKKREKKFGIICQINKSLSKEVVYKYFNEIINILSENRSLISIIKGFDIIGNEINGYSLNYYDDIIQHLND